MKQNIDIGMQSSEKKTHYKLYKSKKHWVVAGITMFSIGLAATGLNNVHAATETGSDTATQSSSDNASADESTANSENTAVLKSKSTQSTNATSDTTATSAGAATNANADNAESGDTQTAAITALKAKVAYAKATWSEGADGAITI